MKIYSVLGKMKGKIGNIVVSSVNGQVVGREYNPNVANPNTAQQQNTRSKFKLASQLSAALAPVIAIRKDGNKTARNQFVQQNFDTINYNTGVASINLNQVQLTKSQIPFAGFNADRSVGDHINVELNIESSASLTRVVYILYRKLSDGTLQLFDSVIASIPGDDGKFPAQLAYTDAEVLLYAYGIKDLDNGITSKFGNMTAPNAEKVAQLLVANADNMASVQLTKTAGLTMAIGEETGDSDDVERVLVTVLTSGNGSATGGGRYEIGQAVTLRATPIEDATFEGWHIGSASGARVSTANPYTFNAESDVILCAKFTGGPTPHYNIALSADPSNGGTVSGGGSKEEGSSCTVVATPAEGMMFAGWFEGGELVSNNASFTFTVDRARTLVAQFGEAPENMILTATVDGSTWNRDSAAPEGHAVIAITTTAEANGKTMAMVDSSSKPAIGSQLTANTQKTISQSACSETMQIGTLSWLVIGEVNGNKVTIEEVWPYSLTNGD